MDQTSIAHRRGICERTLFGKRLLFERVPDATYKIISNWQGTTPAQVRTRYGSACSHKTWSTILDITLHLTSPTKPVKLMVWFKISKEC